uniref:AtpZ/AtpI family protein n=1 Tax=Acetatifactor sp. TaxID=1872090 RepID=UPI004055C3A7
MKRRKGYDRSVYSSLALVTQFGINMMVPICLMTAFGIFLDDKLGTSYWVIVLFLIGAVAGGQNIYRMAKKIYEKPSTRDRLKEQGSRDADIREIKKDK